MISFIQGVLIFLVAVLALVSAIPVIDDADLETRIRQFDAPRAAPMARIIKLSNVLRGPSSRNRLLKDKAGSFDNFEAFEGLDAEEIGARDSDARRTPRPEERNVGNFFPEDEIPE